MEPKYTANKFHITLQSAIFLFMVQINHINFRAIMISK